MDSGAHADDTGNVSKRTRECIDALFTGTDRDTAENIISECLSAAQFGQRGAGLERIHLAAVRCSEGCLDRLADAIHMGTTDWRDLLVAAGFADDPRAHLSWVP